MNVTEVERKESTKHCCGNGCCRIDSAEHEGEGRALIEMRITENNSTNADRGGYGMLEAIVSTGNMNQAYLPAYLNTDCKPFARITYALLRRLSE